MLPVRVRTLSERLAEPGFLTRLARGRAVHGELRGEFHAIPLPLSQRFFKRGLILVWLALACWSQPGRAWDDPLAGVETSARMEGVDLVLNGAGLREILFFDVYVAALYLPHKLGDPHVVLRGDLPRRLRISLLRDMDADRDLQRLLGGMKDNNTPEALAAIHAQVEHFLRLIRAMGKVDKGSVILLDYLPDTGTRVWLNRRLLGTVPGEDFNRCVMKIWLGDRPIQKSLKRALLGETKETG